MKVLKTNDFVSERAKAKPVTNSEWDRTKKELEKIKLNPFGLTEKDLTGQLKGFPMGVVVRMLEEQEKQGNKADVKVFQQNKKATSSYRGFAWVDTDVEHPMDFWTDVIRNSDFVQFFKKYPEYKKYNRVKTITPNKYHITENSLTGKIKNFPIGVVVKMMEEQEKQGRDSDITVFQRNKEADFGMGGFDWGRTKDGHFFWSNVISYYEFDVFYESYPEYEKYNIY